MRIVCQQLAPVVGALEENLARCTQALADAIDQGGQLVVLPELATSGYVFRSREEAADMAITASHPVFARWAAELDRVDGGQGVAVVGFCEAGEAGALYSSAAVIGRDGVIDVYRKTHLWNREKLFLQAGDVPPRVLATGLGQVAVVVCYDLEFPEVTRALALGGAELIVACTNWPLVPRPEGEHPPEMIMAMAAARANRVFIACCDRSGVERGQVWTEGSTIVGADGWVLATAVDGTAVADVDLSVARDKTLTPLADALGDRRPELYGELLAPAAPQPLR